MAEDSKPTPTPAKTYLTAAADLALNIDEKTEQMIVGALVTWAIYTQGQLLL